MLNDWMGNRSTIDAFMGRSAGVTNWKTYLNGLDILDKPVTVTINRNGVDLSPQVVRFEYNDNVPFERELEMEIGQIDGVRGLLIGYKNHPTVTDTDIKFGDRFTVSGQTFECLQILPGFVHRTVAVLNVVDS